MRARGLLAMLAACAISVSAGAETLVVHGQVVVAPAAVACPHRGETMHQVARRFGAPEKRLAAVGKPPITRWDYPDFTVYFEYTRVVHSVVHGPAG